MFSLDLIMHPRKMKIILVSILMITFAILSASITTYFDEIYVPFVFIGSFLFLSFLYVLIFNVGVSWLPARFQAYSYFVEWVYIRVRLFTKSDFIDAANLSVLFVEDLYGGYYPCKEVLQISEEMRLPYLYKFARYLELKYRFGDDPLTRPMFAERFSRYNSINIVNSDQSYVDSLCEALGLSYPCSLDGAKMAYREKIKMYHPDIYMTSSEAMKTFSQEMTIKLNNVYSELKTILAERNQ